MTPHPHQNSSRPVPVDAPLQQVIGLLQLVRQDEAVLRRLEVCTTQLKAIRVARLALLDVTGTELREAAAVCAPTSPSADATASSGVAK